MQSGITPISAVKNMAQGRQAMVADNTKNKREVLVEGVFYKDPVPLLLTDIKWTRINARMPDSVYISLEGAPIEEMCKALDKYQGARVRLKGVVNIAHNNTHKDLTVLESTFISGAR